MRILREDEVRRESTPTVLAVGVFDGLHRGHRALLETVVADARELGAVPGVVTFDPHPASVLAPERAPAMLARLDQRLEGLEAAGIEVVRVIEFDTARASQNARDFAEGVLAGELSAREIVVGRDFRFGRGREGDVALLETVGAERGFSVRSIETLGSPRFSSSSVRAAVAGGDLDAAAQILGRAYRVRGEVAHGDHRGTGLGFATANLHVGPAQLLPAPGIYAGGADTGGLWYPAAVSIGTRPHFYEDGELLFEAHLIGYEGDLYGATLDVELYRRLRAERAFASDEALIEQIGRDVTETQEIFEQVRA